MSVNLLDLAKNHLGDDVISQVSTMLGEDQSSTQKAFDGALPVILGGLVQKSAEPGGNSAIMDMVGQATTPDRAAGDVIEPVGGLSGNLSTLLADNLQMDSLLSMGAGMIQSLFGNKTDTLVGALASHSGIKATSAMSLMSIAGPLLLSVLGRKMAADETGISGLSNLLAGQQHDLQAAMPTGFAALAGILPGAVLTGGVTAGENLSAATPADPFAPSVNTAELVNPVPAVAPAGFVPPVVITPIVPVEPVAPVIASVPPAGPVRPVAAPPYAGSDEPSPESGNRWLPWLLLLMGAVALFFILRSCRQEGTTGSANAAADSVKSSMNDAAGSVAATADSVGSDVGAAVDSAGSAVSDATARLGAFFKRKLPSGLELNIPEKGIENNLVMFIEDKNRPVDKTTWFNFDRLLFDTGKATLRPESQEQLDNVAAILKEYPAVAVKLGGYTDNTGSAELNRTLSQERATMVMSRLVALGIDKSRLEAEGYGSEHPVATNETEAGRAENRRIAIRVTKK